MHKLIKLLFYLIVRFIFKDFKSICLNVSYDFINICNFIHFEIIKRAKLYRIYRII